MRRKERGRQLLRILKLIKLFEHSRYGLTIKELCKEMDVTRRTLYRDLDQLEEAGYRFVKEGGAAAIRRSGGSHRACARTPTAPTRRASCFRSTSA